MGSGNVITASVANSRSVQALGTRTVNHRQRAAPNAQLKSNTVSQIAATLASSLLSVGTFAAVMNVLRNNDEAAAALRENPLSDLTRPFWGDRMRWRQDNRKFTLRSTMCTSSTIARDTRALENPTPSSHTTLVLHTTVISYEMPLVITCYPLLSYEK